jgi:hypothetical protein
MLTRLLVAALALCAASLSAPAAFATPSPAPPPTQTAPAPQPPPAADPAARAFADWVQRSSTALAHASQASDTLGEISSVSSDRRAFLESLPTLRSHIERAHQILVDARGELDALGEFQTPGASADLVELGGRLHRDGYQYIDNMQGLLDAMTEFMDAIQANDARRVQAVTPRLRNSVYVMIDGQRTILRGRQQMFTAEQPVYHSLGAMIAMYDGMIALTEEDDATRRAQLTAAAASAERWGQSDRAAVAALRTQLGTLSASDRAIVNTMLQFEEETCAVNDRVVVFLRNAVAAPGSQRIDLIQGLSQMETDYQSISMREVAAMAQYNGVPQQ